MSARELKTLNEALHERVRSTPDRPAVSARRGDGWHTWTWDEVGLEAERYGRALVAAGVGPSERVAILANTRPEWIFADLGVLLAAAATTTVYPTNTADDCHWILSDSESVLLFAEDAAQVDKVLSARPDSLRRVVVLDGEHPDATTLQDFLAAGATAALDRSVQPADLATLIYTSGTTGRPKGVELTHASQMFAVNGMASFGLCTEEDKQLLFLPMSHVYAKTLALLSVVTGAEIAVEGDFTRLKETMPQVQPTFMACVPRVFEKVHAGILERVEAGTPLRRAIFRWAQAVGKEAAPVLLREEEPRGWLGFRYRLAKRLVFQRIHDAFGGRIRAFVSGGAPLSPEIADFFLSAGMLILEGYGMTESSAASCGNRPDDFKFGTVGKPLPGVDIRIADDGEILIGGGGVMRGYHNRPEATAETLVDGWIHTGDIGRFDDDGFLVITDRKKDLIITAGGKNIAPQIIENQLKARSRVVGQCVMLGDRQPYCVALISLDVESFPGRSYEDLVADPELKAAVQADLDALNAGLASYEQIKKFALLPRDLSVERGELTPKMSVRRRVVQERYAELLDGLYGR